MTHYVGGNDQRRLEQRLRAIVARMDAADASEDVRQAARELVHWPECTNNPCTCGERGDLLWRVKRADRPADRPKSACEDGSGGTNATGRGSLVDR